MDYGNARDWFKDNFREAYELLQKYHEVPPRRALLSLPGDNIVVLIQPMNIDCETEVHKFPYDQQGACEALVLLEEQRVLAAARFDSDEPKEEEVAQRRENLMAQRTRQDDESGKTVTKRRQRVSSTRKPWWTKRPARKTRLVAAGVPADNVIRLLPSNDTTPAVAVQ